MAEITAAMVQELREATNVGMMECKRALVEAGGDKEKAIRLLRERGVAIAAKKASRAANQGLVGAALRGGKTGSLAAKAQLLRCSQAQRSQKRSLPGNCLARSWCQRLGSRQSRIGSDSPARYTLQPGSSAEAWGRGRPKWAKRR